jgi:hypothetical protein
MEGGSRWIEGNAGFFENSLTHIMEKKLYYRFDNGDTPVICKIQDVTDMLEAEARDYNEDSNKEDEPIWNITLVFLTDDEFANLPEA